MGDGPLPTNARRLLGHGLPPCGELVDHLGPLLLRVRGHRHVSGLVDHLRRLHGRGQRSLGLLDRLRRLRGLVDRLSRLHGRGRRRSRPRGVFSTVVLPDRQGHRVIGLVDRGHRVIGLLDRLRPRGDE
eukprot:7751412-Pyramimonas_sp.AAC.1